jgi:tetratricopeptide (TPR) repeat protein
MKRLKKSWVLAAILTTALAGEFASRTTAQGDSTIHGTIIDVSGKPWVDIGVQAVSDQGLKTDTKTDKDGKYTFPHMKSGQYSIFVQLPAPNKPYEGVVKISTGQDAPVDFNFKEIAAKQGSAYQEAAKKQEEAKNKLAGLKVHFDAGNALIDQEKLAKAEVSKAPADQREAAKQKLTDLSEQAAKEFQEAAKNLGEKDPNAHLVWYKLGEAYDTGGRNEEAAQAYQQAIAAKGDVPGYYNNLGNVLARAGKIDEAKAAYTKSAELDPPNAATAWRNYGISLYQAGRLVEAVEPLQKSSQIDPKSAQTWYLMASCMMASPDIYKKVGDKLVVTPLPGTVEAYQKAIELDPNGTWGNQAKQGLEQLNQMTGGIDTKVNVKKKKS